MSINFFIKLIFCVVFYCMFSQEVVAQEKQKSTFWDFNRYNNKDFPRISGSLGISIYDNFGKGVFQKRTFSGLNYQAGIHVEYMSLGLSFQHNQRHRLAINTPNDFNGKMHPLDQVRENIISVKKLFYTKYPQLQLTAQIGVADIKLNQAQKFTKQSSYTGGFFNFPRDNYRYNFGKKLYTGLYLNMGIDYVLLKGLGLSTNLATSICQKNVNYISLETNIKFGYVRKN